MLSENNITDVSAKMMYYGKCHCVQQYKTSLIWCNATVSKGNYPGKCSFYFLPMIDMDPTDMSCIYWANKYGIVLFFTFDQQLCLQAIIITEAKPQDSVLRTIILNYWRAAYTGEFSWFYWICNEWFRSTAAVGSYIHLKCSDANNEWKSNFQG